jgi:hypothetical protein
VAVALNLPTFNGDDGPFLVDAGPADPDGSAAISDASDDADGGGDASVQAPRCTIDSPTEDQRLYYQGDPITFVGSCTSPQGEPLDAHWNSTLAKKQLGNGRELTRDNLVVGSHEITLCANGTSACSDPLQIVVEPLPELSVAISSLAQQGSGEGVYRAEAALVASGTGSGVPPLEFTWIDSLAGEVCTGAKCTFEAPMVPGRHTLRLVAIDGRGRKIKAERSFIVHAPGRSALFEIYERANAVLTGTIKALASDGNFHYVGTDAGYVVQVPADMAETVYPITPTGSMAPRPEVKGLFVHASSNTLYFATSADVQSCDITNGTVKNCVTLTLGNLATAQPRCVRRLSYESTDYLVVGTSTGLWVGANSMLDQGNLRESGAEFNALTESAGKLWIAGSTGLSGYTLGSGGGFAGSPQKYAAAPSALSALAASEDLVWAVPSSGFARYDGDAASWTSWTMSYAEAEFGRLVHNEARSIAITHPLIDGGAHDVIWVGTSAGLSRFDPAIPSFTSYSKVDGLADNSVLQVVALPSNEVLVASPSGLSVYRGQ